VGEPTSAPTDTAISAPTNTAIAEAQPCAAASAVSLVQTAVSVTATSAPTASVSPTPRPPTPTPRPAPKEDHVGYPEGYRDSFKLMFVYDRNDNKQVRVVCGNAIAASIRPGEPFPYGSILVMETWRTKQDANGQVIKDAQGHFIRESLAGLFVMRKEKGFGVDYQGLRTGEWEYVAYRPDQSFLTSPEHTANCAACHVGASQDRDWVFRANDIFFLPGQYAAAPVPGKDEVALNSMSFFPRQLTIKVGTTITWVNHDVTDHTVTANDGSLDSGNLKPGDTFSFTFNTVGKFEYHCSHHPEQMRATIEVTQ
jgi:plastocyanin